MFAKLQSVTWYVHYKTSGRCHISLINHIYPLPLPDMMAEQCMFSGSESPSRELGFKIPGEKGRKNIDK